MLSQHTRSYFEILSQTECLLLQGGDAGASEAQSWELGRQVNKERHHFLCLRTSQEFQMLSSVIFVCKVMKGKIFLFCHKLINRIPELKKRLY